MCAGKHSTAAIFCAHALCLHMYLPACFDSIKANTPSGQGPAKRSRGEPMTWTAGASTQPEQAGHKEQPPDVVEAPAEPWRWLIRLRSNERRTARCRVEKALTCVKFDGCTATARCCPLLSTRPGSKVWQLRGGDASYTWAVTGM